MSRWLSYVAFLSLLSMPACDTDSSDSGSSGTSVIDNKKPAFTNRLADAKSPYLRQHAHNPVDWYQWGDEAFEKAIAENKPVFLSIGYATCQWCHVMERETFSDEEMAKFLNEHFVCIKLDREERPDIDRIYLGYVEMTTNDAGWPLSVFLTPDKKPFFGGTYYPLESREGKMGFRELTERIHEKWESNHETIKLSADSVFDQIKNHLGDHGTDGGSSDCRDIIANAVSEIRESYDSDFGGFGNAPKFPAPSEPAFLLSQGVFMGDQELIDMVKYTCDRMAAGGIHDQLGGGFSRYSVDEKWLVPHFEKMLYDNAQLLDLYVDVYLVTKDPSYADIAHDIADYVLGQMTHPSGGFFSAEDAASEGYEGKFYVWQRKELEDLLEADEYAVVERYYGITEEGNFIDHSHENPIKGQNVLSIADPDITAEEKTVLETAKKKMLAHRDTRPRPLRDEKVLTSWNGLMLAALTKAGVSLNEPRYLDAAIKNLSFIKSDMWDSSTKTLYHRWYDGVRDDVQLLEAYAAVLKGAISLYEATLDSEHLEFAVELADAILLRFEDENGGFWQMSKEVDEGLVNLKDYEDGVIPSGNSLAAYALLKLADISGHENYRKSASKAIDLAQPHMSRWPGMSGYMLQASSYGNHEPIRIVIQGMPSTEAQKEWLSTVHSHYLPHSIIMAKADAETPNMQISVGQRQLGIAGDNEKIDEILKDIQYPNPTRMLLPGTE